ncbi:hypothetical protein [Spongiactinospora sp. 9N601]|uniref:hypothetical protein n=1 Tax=Spongiactinospora sp. 9N601 TaxID=3375149 RepID=UPI0037AA237D
MKLWPTAFSITTYTAGTALICAATLSCSGVLHSASGCTPEDLALIPILQSQKVLSSHPPTVRAVSSQAGCDQEDEHVFATKQYAYQGSTPDIIAFYDRVAEEDGWKWVKRTQDACLRKTLNNVTAYMHVSAIIGADSDHAVGDYAVTVSAAHGADPDDGGVMC